VFIVSRSSGPWDPSRRISEISHHNPFSASPSSGSHFSNITTLVNNHHSCSSICGKRERFLREVDSSLSLDPSPHHPTSKSGTPPTCERLPRPLCLYFWSVGRSSISYKLLEFEILWNQIFGISQSKSVSLLLSPPCKLMDRIDCNDPFLAFTFIHCPCWGLPVFETYLSRDQSSPFGLHLRRATLSKLRQCATNGIFRSFPYIALDSLISS
jgi:hypothetical protein